MLDDLETVRAACCIAGLDGEVAPAERALLERLARRAGVGHASLEAMIDCAVGDRDFFEQQLRFATRDPEATMVRLLAIATADGALDVAERVILHHFADRIGLAPDRFDELLTRAADRPSG